MRGRLFWKILVLFWITFMAIVEGVWVVFALYGSHRKPLDVRLTERISTQQMATAQVVLEQGGPDALEGVVSAWPPAEQARLSLLPGDAPPPPTEPGQPVPPLSALVRSPDGVLHRLVYDTITLRREFRPPGPLNIPMHLVVLGLIGGLIFSAVLAWYLTKPIQRLRGGFSQLAQGNLGVRLAGHIGRRRDELADLARDFDTMAERLQHLISARERMLHVVSHELRSPLARLHLAVGLARQDQGRLEASLDRIELEAKRLDEIVGEVLTLARVESGTPPMDDYFDVGSLAIAVAADASFEAQSLGVDVRTAFDPEAAEDWPTVRGNAQLARRALENVVRNALRHSPSGTKVTLAVEPDRDRKRFAIRITDHGPGMSPKALETLFEPFVRGQGQKDGQGFGLGLAIAHKAVLAHGGSIEARNRTEGGLEVSIGLPFGPANAR